MADSIIARMPSRLLEPRMIIGLLLSSIAVSIAWLFLFTLNMARNSGFLIVDLIGFMVAATCAYYQYELLSRTKHKEEDYGFNREPIAESHVGAIERAGAVGRPEGDASPAAAPSEHTCKGIPADCSGLVIGEVEAFRAWRVLGDYLASGMGAIWLSDAPMKGTEVDMHTASGVYAFKSLTDARSYFADQRTPYAVGKVKLWGTVVEHETGYRADFAKPLLIIEAHNGASASAIRKRYGLGE
jgi:hypothetical protein